MTILNSVFNMQVEVYDFLRLEASGEFPEVDSIKVAVRDTYGEHTDIVNREHIPDVGYTLPVGAMEQWVSAIQQFLRNKEAFTQVKLGEALLFEMKTSQKEGYVQVLLWYQSEAWRESNVDHDAVGFSLTVTPKLLADFAEELLVEWKGRKTIAE